MILRNRKGNIVAMLMGTVAMVGIVSVSAMNMIGGPITTAAKVTHQNMAQNDLLMNAKVIVMHASTLPQMGDGDGDGYIEPVAFVPTSDDSCNITLPGQGGCLPHDIGAILTDPWGTPYAYCVWDHGGSHSSTNRIDGEDSTSGAVLAIISAGPNKRFETPCLPYDGDPDTNDEAINPQGIGDDLVQIYTYAAAVAGLGGLWELKLNEPETAVIDKKLEVGDVAGGTGFAFDTQTGTGEFPYVKTDFLASKSGGNTPVTMDSNIALDGRWLSGDGGDEGIYVDANGNVGIAAGKMYQIDGQDFIGVGGQEDSTVLGLGAVAHRVSSTVVGFRAGSAATTGGGHSFFGVSAGGDTTGNLNAISAFGIEAGRYNKGSSQSAFGARAGYENEGHSQSAFGNNAGRRNTGNNQSAFGSGAGTDNTTLGQSAFGVNAGSNNTGSHQSVFGYTAGYNNTGDYQVAFGRQAGNTNSGSFQTAIGYIAGSQNTGNFLTALGAHAGRNNTGHNVVAIGYGAGRDNTLDNQFIVQQSNVRAIPLIQGDFATGYIGIGTATPSRALEVVGDIRASESLRLASLGAFSDVGGAGNARLWAAQALELGAGGSGGLALTIAANGTISFHDNRITGVATPAATTDAANKAYVDTLGNRTCANAQILKFQSGSWQCAADNSGGGGSDNLGNHTATQTLNMAGNEINAASRINISSAETQARGISVTVGEATQVRGIHVSASGIQASGIYAAATGTQSTGIQTSGELRGVHATATGTGARAVYGIATSTSGSSYGVFGQSTASSSGRGVQGTGGYVGVYGQAATDQGRGVSGQGGLYGVEGTGASTVAGSAGGYFTSTNPTGYGVRAIAIQSTGVNYGIWASSQSPEGFGVYGNNGWNTGYGVYCNTTNPSGCGGNRAWTNASDGRLKHHVTDLATEDGLATIMKLRPVTYQWRTDDNGRIELGFIAQEVEDVLPELVGTSPDTTITLEDGTEQEITNVKSLSYSGFVVPLVKAVQELKTENDALRAELQAANDNFRRELDAIKAAVGK